jgi:hypothetical protein
MRHAGLPFAVALVAVALPLSAASSPAAAQAAPVEAHTDSTPPDSARLALARDLMELMHVGPMMLKGLELGLETQKAASPNIPEVFWTNFEARARRELPTFVDSVAPVYARRFTAQELQDMIAFYSTPTGRHLADEGGAISAELMHAGQRWGMMLGADTMKELAAKGIMIP